MSEVRICELELVKTCSACPEQYDVLLEGDRVGYMRLRHGHFYASVPDVGGQVVYEAEPRGDGCFDPDERDYYLGEALWAIAESLPAPLSTGRTGE